MIKVVDGRIEMALVPDESVPIFSLPERPRSSDVLVGMSGGTSLSRPDDVAERGVGQHGKQDVHVVRHDGPGVETIALAVESKERILDKSGDWLRP